MPPNTPQSPRTNVAVPSNDALFTDDEEDEDQVVPPPLGEWICAQGRPETLSPTPQNTQSVRSAIELAAHDLTPSQQSITDKCVEVDLQLSTHPDWSLPNHRLRSDICDLVPLLFQLGFNTEGFPNLEKYLYETVGSLLYQSLLRIALDSVFEEYPEISAVKTKVYRMLKCHLSIINHSSVTQFDDITFSNHNFDRVAGADFYEVSGDSRPDLSTQTDLNDTYYSVYSQAQRQAYRVTERSLHRIRRDRTNSCPDLVQLQTQVGNHSHTSWQYFTAQELSDHTTVSAKTDKETQTCKPPQILVKESGAQYSSLSDDSDSDSSDSESELEGTENITVVKRYLNRHSLSSDDIYTATQNPNKRFRTSTPEPVGRNPEKEPVRFPLKEIINHQPALHIPPTNIVVAPGGLQNIQRGVQRVQRMAGRSARNANLALQGADPALVQILQMMQNRDANRDNSRKQFLMFPKEAFTGEDKKKAKSHWAEFSKYLDYQDQQGTLPRDLAHSTRDKGNV